jgi:hypothetical protein
MMGAAFTLAIPTAIANKIALIRPWKVFSIAIKLRASW